MAFVISLETNSIPKRVAADFIRTGKAVYRKPCRFRESRKTFATANKWYEVEKHLNKNYTKRRIIEGEPVTQAWHIDDYKREVCC